VLFPEYANVKEAACKICTSSYKGIWDPKYLKDLLAYKEVTFYPKSLRIDTVRRMALIERPGDKE
jgi:HKD family nuclease